jgi:hypothetical protein
MRKTTMKTSGTDAWNNPVDRGTGLTIEDKVFVGRAST